MQRTSRLAHPSELTNVLLRLVVLPKNILQCTSSRLKIKKININILIAKEGLESLQPPLAAPLARTTTNHKYQKKSPYRCFGEQCLAKNCIFSKLKKIRFFVFYAKRFYSVPYKRTWKILQKNSKCLIKFLWTFCQYFIFSFAVTFFLLFLLEKL